MPGYYWKPCSSGAVPPDAFVGGRDKDGSNLYVGRALFNRDMLPAKIVPGHGCAYVSYGGKEHRVTGYEVMVVSKLVWQNSSRGQVPPGAVVVGQTVNGEKLYTGRVSHNGTLTLGKVHPSHGVCYIPYDGREIPFPSYDVLVSK